MSNIEEDIKTMHKIISFYRDLDIINNNDKCEEIKAIENILIEREADKKRVKELEEEREIVGMPVRNKRDGRIGIILKQWENGSIAVLENIKPRVINTHDSWDTLEMITDEVKHLKIKEDSIA